MPMSLLWFIANKLGEKELHYYHKQRIRTALQKPVLNERFVKAYYIRICQNRQIYKHNMCCRSSIIAFFRVCNNPAFLQITILSKIKGYYSIKFTNVKPESVNVIIVKTFDQHDDFSITTTFSVNIRDDTTLITDSTSMSL